MENKYYELTDMVERLGCIIDDLTERDYIEMLQDIKYRALEEAETLEEILKKQEEKEQQERENEYIRMSL